MNLSFNNLKIKLKLSIKMCLPFHAFLENRLRHFIFLTYNLISLNTYEWFETLPHRDLNVSPPLFACQAVKRNPFVRITILFSFKLLASSVSYSQSGKCIWFHSKSQELHAISFMAT